MHIRDNLKIATVSGQIYHICRWNKKLNKNNFFDICNIFVIFIFPQDQLNRNKVPEWQRMAGKAAKEVEKFAKEKADIVLMHWRDKMGIAQKEVRIIFLY